MGTLRSMDGTGDTKLVWDSDNADEVANAKRTFEDLKAKRFVPFAVKENGKPGVRVYEFDKDAEKIIMVPPFQGG